MNNNLFKRRSVFIKKGFQGRFMLSAFVIILLSSLCSALLIYWLTGGALQAQSHSAHVNIADAWQRLGVSILIGNLVSLLVAGAVAVISVLYTSHKIAGPLHRFEALCGEIGNGNLDGDTQLREKDQLQELAQAFAAMVAKLRDRRDRQAKLLAEIDGHIGILTGSDNLATEQSQALAALAAAVARLSRPDDGHA
ncbi:MAG: HAMP domain-containing protein [Methylococcaceae bacterium]|nr:MAG: HAMP domain-containing protein [Methylococcaceae bacterium]